MSEAAHKDQLSKHIKCLKTFFPEDFSFYPETWLLPQEQAEFDEYAHKQKARGTPTYIVKPCEGSQGEGIFLIQSSRDLSHLKVPSIVQKYIAKPFLIHGFKFDLRLYVLVAAVEPLEVYISCSGMARFCTVPYEAPTVKNMHQTLMHLTNYSLNKRSKDFVHSEDGQGGSKQTLTSVLRHIEARGYSKEELWERIENLVCRTVVALLPQLIVEEKNHTVECSLKQPMKGFQLLGFDILLDNKLSPHLLEVNAHPSLRVDFELPKAPGIVEYVPSPVDMEIKLPAVRDTLRIIAAKIKKERLLNHAMHMMLYCRMDTADVVSESCFAELFPARLGNFSHLRMFERCAQLFCRTCKLCRSGFTSADVDILYIEMCRNHSNTYERNALSFHGFCTAVVALARRLYGEAALASIASVLDECELAINN